MNCICQKLMFRLKFKSDKLENKIRVREAGTVEVSLHSHKQPHLQDICIRKSLCE